MRTEKRLDLDELAEYVAERAFEIVMEKLEDYEKNSKSSVSDVDIQHVGYSKEIMGYNK